MKKATEMTPAEREAALAEIRRTGKVTGPTPPDPEAPRRAKDMAEAERREWLNEHRRRLAQ